MGFLSNYTNSYLAVAKDKGRPFTNSSDSDKSTERPSLEDIEKIIFQDPQTFGTLTRIRQLIMYPGFEIKADVKGSQSEWDSFFKNIGQIGLRMNKEEIMDAVVQDSTWYGKHWIELVYDTTDTKIVDLKPIDAKKMDFARNSSGDVAIDDVTGEPLGYIMKLGYGARGLGDEIPYELKRKISRGSGEVFLLPKRIALIRLFPYGNRMDSIGLVETAYQSIKRKLAIEEAQTNSIYARGTYPVIGYVGSETHEPKPQEMVDTLDSLSNMKHNRYQVFPYTTKIEALEVKQSDIVESTLQYLRHNIGASTGLPLAFAIGTGEATNRSTLATQQQVLEVTLQAIVNKITSDFKKYVLDKISEVNNIKGSAHIKWGDISVEEKNDKSNRLIASVNSGIIAPEEARKYVLKVEDLEEDQSAYKKFREPKVEKPTTDKASKEKPSSDTKK